jgi:hypothetical protein
LELATQSAGLGHHDEPRLGYLAEAPLRRAGTGGYQQSFLGLIPPLRWLPRVAALMIRDLGESATVVFEGKTMILTAFIAG